MAVFSNISAFSSILGATLGAPGDTYIITDTRKKPRKELDDTAAFKKFDIQKLDKQGIDNLKDADPLLYEQIKSDLTTANEEPQLQKAILKRDEYAEMLLKAKKDAISELKEMQAWLALKRPDLSPKRREKELKPYRDKVATLDKKLEEYTTRLNPKRNKLEPTLGLFSLGKTANDEIYNNLDLLEFGGMVPTYQQLPNYDKFFAPAENRNSFAGYGLDDTKTLIADICRKHYKECDAIAKHLKGDSLLQSCFNLWHWLHHNIRYEYDRDGREEVRTPLRVWADRRRGVDCDCLSVFAWCVLTCMGYHPAFELVAFRGKAAFSHIFVNCDGVVVDRVWFIFNQRPPAVTKRELYKVNLLHNLGKLF